MGDIFFFSFPFGRIGAHSGGTRYRGTTLPCRIFTLLSALFFLGALPFGAAHASTLWGASGSPVEGGGTVVAKNYDGQPVHCELKIVLPRDGIPYLGLFPLHSKKGQGPIAGINQKGLAVVSAAPESLSESKMSPSAERITEMLLTGHETVDGVLAAPRIFRKGFPIFYLVADSRKIALAEVPPQGEPLFSVTENGTVSHTNHYIQERFQGLNRRPRKESVERLARIGALAGSSTAMPVDSYIAMGKDKGSGPDDAILRKGRDAGAERTLASWVLWLPRGAPPELHVGFYGDNDTEREYDFRLDRSFWTEGVE